jgi:hypothetical protein
MHRTIDTPVLNPLADPACGSAPTTDELLHNDRMWIMIAGPYSSGARTDEERAENLRAMNRVALDVFRRGHVPVIGVNLALPVIQVAGPGSFDELMMPLSLALAERCDAALRIGGPSAGADQEVERIRARGGAVYSSVDEIPGSDAE